MDYSLIEVYKYKDLERFTYAQLESDEVAKKENYIILYSPNETNFDTLGEGVLDTVIEPILTEELNGMYSISLKILKDSRGKYKRLKPLSIIKALGQLFRVPLLNGVKDKDFYIEVTAKHIFYDVDEFFNLDRRVREQNVYEALSRLLEVDTTGKYRIGITDLTSVANANFIEENVCTSIFKKVLPRWGGELLRDNYTITIKQRLGKYNPNLIIRYGSKASSIKKSVDYTQMCTRLYAKGKDGITLEEVNNKLPYLDSDKIKDYPKIFPLKVNFENAETGEELLEEARKFLKEYEKPLVTVSVSLHQLAEEGATEELRKAVLLNLGDTVTVRDEDLNIDEEMRVVKISKHCITGVKTSIVLGSIAPTMLNSLDDIEDSLGGVEDTITEIVQNNTDIDKTLTEISKEIYNLYSDDTEIRDRIGVLEELPTEQKDNLVHSIAEVNTNLETSIAEVNNRIDNISTGGGDTGGGDVSNSKIDEIYNTLILNGAMPPKNPKFIYTIDNILASSRKGSKIGYEIIFNGAMWLHNISWVIDSVDSVKSFTIYLDNINIPIFNGTVIKQGDTNRFNCVLSTPIRLNNGVKYLVELGILSEDTVLYDTNSIPLYSNKCSAYIKDSNGAITVASNPTYGGGLGYSLASAYI